MANPSHNTASPDPGNPEQTSNPARPEPLSSVALAKEDVEGPNGRPDPSTPPAASLRKGFDELSPNGVRRFFQQFEFWQFQGHNT